jgi:hypothetical protein
VTRVALVAVVAALACTGPVGPFPDGPLAGEVVSGPVTDWPFAQERILELETNSDDPYSVNVHFVADGPLLWVATVLGDSSGWGARISADGRVRVREGRRVWERRAVRVTDAAEIARVAALYREKYVLTPEISDDEGTLVFRLDPR